jgi:hypothetical protein
MDLSTLPAAAFTTLDGVTQMLAALCYALVGAAAWLRATGDIRTRVFLALAAANVIVCSVPTIWWLRGTTDPARLPLAATAVVMAALGVGALLLFHFSQVFPRRRPWIRSSGAQMALAYCLAPVTIAGMVWFAPPSVAAMTRPYILLMIVFGFPLIVLVGIVLPVTAIVSLARSHRELPQTAGRELKRAIEMILLSQVAGGVLAALFAPVVAVAAPNSVSQSMLTLLIWMLGLLTPIAFAIAVWRGDLLSISAD